jgi:hypothetical protein
MKFKTFSNPSLPLSSGGKIITYIISYFILDILHGGRALNSQNQRWENFPPGIEVRGRQNHHFIKPVLALRQPDTPHPGVPTSRGHIEHLQ